MSPLSRNLKLLQRAIERNGLSDLTFDRWNAVKGQLGERHRSRVLIAWSRAVYSGNRDRLSEAISAVIAEIDRENLS